MGIRKLVEGYEGVILNYRIGPKTQNTKECLIRVLGVDASEARRMIGWKVCWPSEEPRIYGRVAGHHGRKGTLRVRFERGLPGQALSSLVKIVR